MDYKLEIATLVSLGKQVEVDQLYKSIEVPPKRELGDYAFPCFVLSKTLKKSPNSIAEEVIATLQSREDLPLWLAKVENQGGYVNFFLNRQYLAWDIVSQILRDPSMDLTKERASIGRQTDSSNHVSDILLDKNQTNPSSFLCSKEGEGKTVIVEYSSPNIAKPFHVGHAFTTILGHSLARIYETLGYEVKRFNHLGDYGTQFGKLIVAYTLWGDETALETAPIQELLRIYVKFHEAEKEDPTLTEQARESFQRLEANGAEEMALWSKFRLLSLKEFDQVYKRLGVTFDNFNGESFYSDQIDNVLALLSSQNLLLDSQGAKIVDLEEYSIPPCIILKSDKTTIYASRDLAAAIYRYQEYHFHKNIYVVGNPQALHFKQVFSVLDKAGFSWAKDCVHVGFGLVKFADRKFSTREGNVVLLDDLLEESVSKTYQIIMQNNKNSTNPMEESEIKVVAEKVGLAAVIYTYVRSGRERDIVFAWEDILDFEGDSAPYLLYTYARSNSILRKGKEKTLAPALAEEECLKLLDGQEEYELIRLMADFPDAIQKAQASHEPFIIARQLSQIARAFNRFYNNSKILIGEDQALLRARLALCQSVCKIIEFGCYLLGFEVVDKM